MNQSRRVETEGIAIRQHEGEKCPPTPEGFVWIQEGKNWSLYKLRRG